MAKKESTFVNMVVTLLVVTLVASTSLAFVFEITKEPIAKAQLAKKIEAIRQVLPEFDNNPVEEMQSVTLPGETELMEVYPSELNGQVTGMAVKSYSKKGFSGIIWVMVGFNSEGKIHDVTVLEHKETPGLGSKMNDEKFRIQFREKDPAGFNLAVKKDGGEVDAITAATISSRAFSDAVERAYKVFKQQQQDHEQVANIQ
jgi:electron transport complex protein RnfG